MLQCKLMATKRDISIGCSPSWLLSQDGRTAILPQDAAEIVRAWRGSRVSIAVTDGGGSGGASIFDLSGVETVRARLAAACHWPPSRTEIRGR